jgi:flavin reductase (DIM6/NTAB) family NADH-FMN oxidoreductase RutF
MVMFSTIDNREDGSCKDTIINVESQKEFVVNMATYELRDAVNLTSSPLPSNQNEFEHANLIMIPSMLVKPPRVKSSPIQLECVYYQSIQLPVNDAGDLNRIVIGKVIGVHIDDGVLIAGKVDVKRVRPIARLGYNEFAVVESIFTMKRPF